jgi:aspartate/methionine/tyrosine aminotransferase
VRLSPRTRREIDSPIATAYALLAGRSGERELLDLGQAAPPYPPAPSVIDHVVAVARDPHGADYVGGAGLERLREVFAAELGHDYRGRIHPDDVVVTAGCNQAFCLVASALAEPGDEMVVPLPVYFNHDMWLRMQGMRPVYLEPGPDLVPDPAAAAELITSRTRAIVLVTPGNPTGVTIPPPTIAAFAELARRSGIALVVDETYRSFRGTDEPAHALFADPDWADTVVSLHSFSKALGREVMKLLDCVAIGAPRIGQEAAWAGLTTAAGWRAERAAELAERRDWLVSALAARPAHGRRRAR